ncbi:MAG: hypothetical protein ACW97X_10240 [Candidatus Hodarchaeales archaeon]
MNRNQSSNIEERTLNEIKEILVDPLSIAKIYFLSIWHPSRRCYQYKD